MDQHSQFVESRNQLYLQLRNSLADNIDFSKPQEKITSLNTKWKIVQGGVESHSHNLQECYKLLKHFEQNARKMRSWTLESDLSQVMHSHFISLLSYSLFAPLPTLSFVCYLKLFCYSPLCFPLFSLHIPTIPSISLSSSPAAPPSPHT